MHLSFFMRTLFVCALFTLFSPALFSLDEETNRTDDKTVYYVRNIDFDVSGPTLFGISMSHSRPFAILYHGEIKEGEEIHGGAALEKYIQDKTQLLMNQRVIASASIDYAAAEKDPDGRQPLDLLVTVRDSWNLIALPYPKYDSNEGYNIIIKARDYNFLGTMNPLRIDMGYKRDLYKRNTFNLLIDSNIRFKAMGLDWNFNFDNEFFYTAGEPLSFINTTGFDVELPVKRTTLILSLAHTVNMFPKNADVFWLDYGKYFEGIYDAFVFSAAWRIPLGVNFGDYGELTYTPVISETVPYPVASNWPIDALHRGPVTLVGHSLGVNKVDWIDNLRRGFNVSLNNNYSILPNTNNSMIANTQYDFTGIGHFIINDSLGFSTRLRFSQWFNKFPSTYTIGAGDVLRGIPDRDVFADYMFSVNLDLPVRVLKFTPSSWFTPKLRFFDFELFLSPVLDLAFARDPVLNRRFHPRDMYVSGGFELIIFPRFMRSLYLRISPCFDIIKFVDQSVVPVLGKDSSGARNLELFFGMEFHY
jgi:hypothetical protein